MPFNLLSHGTKLLVSLWEAGRGREQEGKDHNSLLSCTPNSIIRKVEMKL